jgi:membrane fusion protein, multidrug efflux system
MRGRQNPRCMHRLGGALVALAALGLLAALACKKQAFKLPPPEVLVTEVTQKDTPITVEFVGQAKGAEDIDIRARDEGWIESIHFKEGSQVQKGQLLYTIDPRHYEAKLTEAQGQLARAQSVLTNAEIELKRVASLTAMNALSQRDLDNATARRDSAKAEVDASTAAVANAELNLSYTKVTAPITGIIGKTKAKVGDYVGLPPNVMILNTVSNMDPILVDFYLSEADYLWAAKKFRDGGAEAPMVKDLEIVLADGTVFPHKGTVNFADREIDSNTGTIMVEASFPNPQRLIRPGQFGRVRFVGNVRKGALLVPQRAVQELQGSYEVWVVDGANKAQRRPVTTGPKVGTMWVIEQGLKSGDKVILEGLTKVKPDMVVVPKPAGAPDHPASGEQEKRNEQGG